MLLSKTPLRISFVGGGSDYFNNKSNVKGWHSTTDMHTKPEYARLVKALHEAQDVIYIEEHLDSEPFLGNMWANVNPPGGFNRAHLHPNCVWSGVYYVKTPKNCGEIVFLPKLNPYESSTYKTSYVAEKGTYLMFPSYFDHFVTRNNSNDIRISMSLNFDKL